MNERGWGWLDSEIRQIQLLEWIVPQSANTYVPIKPFYDGLGDRGDLTFHVMRDDLKDLERRSLIDLWLPGWAALSPMTPWPLLAPDAWSKTFRPDAATNDCLRWHAATPWSPGCTHRTRSVS
jgi:hypothetical protein